MLFRNTLPMCVRSSLLAVSFFMLVKINGLWAQLDTIHWLPPLLPIESNTTILTPYLDLTTPEVQPFPVTIRDGAGNLLLTLTISNAQPVRQSLVSLFNKVLIPKTALHKAISAGLVVSGPKPFYAAFHAMSSSPSDACYLVCKGRAALGKVFRIGHVRQVSDKTGERFNIIGIMATEDGTSVTFSGFDPTTLFKTWQGDVPVSDPLTMVLQKGQSVVFAHYVGGIGDDQPRNGFMGALLETSKPVAVSCGSWMGAPVVYQANDIGVDQILPLEKVGKEYILCRGNGPTNLEHPLIIAHTEGTQVWVNGETVPAATLHAGEYFSVPATYYLPTNSMYIRTSEPVFVYQMTGGFPTGPTSLGTVSLMFIPPINCGIPNKIDNLHLLNKLGATGFTAHLMIVALRDSAVTVRFNNAIIPIGPPTPVPGNPDFVTYRAMGVFIRTQPVARTSIISGGAIQVTVVARYEGISYAATFSGPELRKPAVHLTQHGDGICPDTLVAHGVFDQIQWVYEDTIVQHSPDSLFVVLAPGPYKAIAYLNGCRSTATVVDSIVVPLTAPQFQYSIQEPSCFGFSDGQITFGAPQGGASPFRYSIDQGQHFSTEGFFEKISAGDYRLIVQDGSGCYNQPIRLTVGQPDSLYVNLVPRHLPDPLRPGGEVVLEAFPSFPAVDASWQPPGSAECPDCLEQTFYPETTGWVSVTTFDADGCPASDSLLLNVEPAVYAPNAIRPGSAAGNDRFTLASEFPLPVHWLLIFDRWGNEVFEKRNFWTNNPADGWPGVFRGAAVTPGIYPFIAEVEVAPGRVVEVKGDVLVAY